MQRCSLITGKSESIPQAYGEAAKVCSEVQAPSRKFCCCCCFKAMIGLCCTKDQLSQDGYLNWKSYFIELTAMVFSECTKCHSCFHVSIQHHLDLLAPPTSLKHTSPALPQATERKIQDRGKRKKKKREREKKKKSLFRAVNGGIGIPDISFPQQGSSDFLLAQPARYFWILAPEWQRELLTAPKPRASQWVNSEHLPWRVQPIPPWSVQEQWSCSKV